MSTVATKYTVNVHSKHVGSKLELTVRLGLATVLALDPIPGIGVASIQADGPGAGHVITVDGDASLSDIAESLAVYFTCIAAKDQPTASRLKAKIDVVVAKYLEGNLTS